MSIRSFRELELIKPIELAIANLGYSIPTPIQAQAIPHLLKNRDLIGCAQTGTGKTAAFALPILQNLALRPQKPQPGTTRVLILTPTRELALQIAVNFNDYGQNLKLAMSVIFGGVGQAEQVKACSRGLDVLVATPGRLLDLMGQGHLRLDKVGVFVLDEADRMLEMGFLPDVKRVLAKLPAHRQTLLFSATMPPKIASLAEKILTDPVRVAVTPVSSTVDSISQKVLFVANAHKRELLKNVLKDERLKRVLIFTRTKHGANRLAKQLTQAQVPANAIHGNKSQGARQAALESFRNGEIRVLVATDIAARGIDVEGISHVINFDLPNEPESYVHRIGRTGRAGARGVALSFCDPQERPQLRSIEKLIHRDLPVMADHPYHEKPGKTADQAGKARPAAKNHRGRRPARPKTRAAA